MRTRFIAGNWKMYMTVTESVAFAAQLKKALAGAKGVEIGVFPTTVALKAVAEALKGSNIVVGAQNMHWEDQGAFTGEIAAGMIQDTGATHVLIGHSERRQYFGETDGTVNLKLSKALAKGLKPIVCVGENLNEREGGRAMDVVRNQITGGMKDLTPDDARKVVVAYEPVWAIGTGKTATPAIAQEMHAAIRKTLAGLFTPEIANVIRIQYGGSVKPDNVKELMSQADIDGALVGGASLKVDSFTALIKFEG
ncbi:MAG: triose-phosphate isomerase [Planctomycetota bacterium]